MLNYIEPLSLLDNEMNGLFRFKDIGLKFGLSASVFDKISAIFIYSYPVQGLIFNDVRWCFAHNGCAILLNPNLDEEQIKKITRILNTSPLANPQTPIMLYSPPSISSKCLEELEELIKDIIFL